MEEVGTLIRKKLQSFRIIHLAMVVGDIVYGVMIVFIHKYSPIPPTITDIETITTIEYSSVALLAIVIIAVNITRKKILASDSIFKKKETAKEQSDEPPFITNYLSSLFIIWALIQIIAISGIILFLVSGKLMIPLVLISIGVFIKLTNGPRLEELNQLAVKHESILVQG